MNKFMNLSLQIKISMIYLFTNLLIFVINLFLMIGINNMSVDMEMVYQDNRYLNDLSEALTNVQDNMTEYLSAKTTDSLENYYRSAQAYSNLADELDDKITDLPFSRMERNIKNMSQNYLDSVSLTMATICARLSLAL